MCCQGGALFFKCSSQIILRGVHFGGNSAYRGGDMYSFCSSNIIVLAGATFSTSPIIVGRVASCSRVSLFRAACSITSVCDATSVAGFRCTVVGV